MEIYFFRLIEAFIYFFRKINYIKDINKKNIIIFLIINWRIDEEQRPYPMDR